jgi:hypothetical protein
MRSSRSDFLRRAALALGVATLTAPRADRSERTLDEPRHDPCHDLCSRADGELISVHETSEGQLRYRRCSCGRIVVELLERNPPRRLAATTEPR